MSQRLCLLPSYQSWAKCYATLRPRRWVAWAHGRDGQRADPFESRDVPSDPTGARHTAGRAADKSSGQVYDALPADHACQPSASQLLRPLHDRMPVILAPDDYPAWLGEDVVRDVVELLRPYPSEEMRVYRAITAFNNVRNDDPSLVEPIGSLT